MRVLSRAGAGAILTLSGVFLAYFLKTVWDGYRESSRTWGPAQCRAQSFEYRTCSTLERGCLLGHCLFLKVIYSQDGVDITDDVLLEQEDSCSFGSRAEAEERGEEVVREGDSKEGFQCFAVPGDKESVSKDDLTRSASERTRDLFGKIFISIFIVLSALVCLAMGTGSFIQAYKYVVDPDSIPERPTRAAGGNVTEPGAAALGSLQTRKAKVETLVAAMSTSESTPQDDTSGENAVECSICLDDNDEGTRVVRLPECDHHFHDKCIVSWLGRGHNVCPVCRSTVLLKEKTAEKTRYRFSRSREDLASNDEETRGDGTEVSPLTHEPQRDSGEQTTEEQNSEAQNGELVDAQNNEASRTSQVDAPPT